MERPHLSQGLFLFPSSLSPTPLGPTPQPAHRGEHLEERVLTPRSTAPSSRGTSPAVSTGPMSTVTTIAASKTATSLKESLDIFKRQHAETQTCIKHELQALKVHLVSEIHNSRDEIWQEFQRSAKQFLAKQDELEKLVQKLDHGPEVLKPAVGDRFQVPEDDMRDDDRGFVIPEERCKVENGRAEAQNGINEAFKSDREITPGLKSAKSGLSVQHQKISQQSLDALEAKKNWELLVADLSDQNEHSLYKDIINEKLVHHHENCWVSLFEACGLLNLIRKTRPDNLWARSLIHPVFIIVTTLMIFVNTVLMGFETHEAIRAVLEHRGEVDNWAYTPNEVFNYIFLAEVMYRIFALRSWFFVCPEWGWNLFDLFVVLVSIVADALSSMNLTFIRAFRLLRAFRVVRVFRVLRFFRELRKMLFAIMACLKSLVWSFVFLVLMIYIFSIFFLQGLTQALDDMDPSSDEYVIAHREVQSKFPGLGNSMVSLVAAVTGGYDWMEVRRPLVHAGWGYANAFLIYVMFVIVGVMNVLTGVFLSSAEEFTDKDLIIQTEKVRVEQQVAYMLEMFKNLDSDHTGKITREQFHSGLQDQYMQAYLSAYQLEPQHVHLLFDILAEGSVDGTVDVTSFMAGMLNLKGEAKAMDTRILRKMLEFVEASIQPISDRLLTVDADDDTFV